MNLPKECSITECECCQEGFCMLDVMYGVDPWICEAKTYHDLIEHEEM